MVAKLAEPAVTDETNQEQDGKIAPVAPLLLSARQSADLCGVSRATWFSWQAAGQIPSPALRRGRVVRWLADEIKSWAVAGSPPREKWEIVKKVARPRL